MDQIKRNEMILPLLALIVVIIIVVVFITKNAKNKDVGNRPGQ